MSNDEGETRDFDELDLPADDLLEPAEEGLEAEPVGEPLEAVDAGATADAGVAALDEVTAEAAEEELEEELEKKEIFLRVLIENALDAFVILNGDGTIRYKSPSNERMQGYTSEEREGRDILEYIHPDDVAKVAGGQVLINLGCSLLPSVLNQSSIRFALLRLILLISPLTVRANSLLGVITSLLLSIKFLISPPTVVLLPPLNTK